MPLTPHMSFSWKSQLNELILKLHLEVPTYPNPIIYRKQNGKIEEDKSVISTCEIYHLSCSFKNFDKFGTFICSTMRTANIDGHYLMQRLCRTSENSFPQIFEKETKEHALPIEPQVCYYKVVLFNWYNFQNRPVDPKWLILTSFYTHNWVFDTKRPKNMELQDQGTNLTFWGKSTFKSPMNSLNEFMVRTDFLIFQDTKICNFKLNG